MKLFCTFLLPPLFFFNLTILSSTVQAEELSDGTESISVVIFCCCCFLYSFPVCSFDQMSLVSWCGGYNVILFWKNLSRFLTLLDPLWTWRSNAQSLHGEPLEEQRLWGLSSEVNKVIQPTGSHGKCRIDLFHCQLLSYSECLQAQTTTVGNQRSEPSWCQAYCMS